MRLLVETLKEHPGVGLLVCYEREAVKLLRKSLSAERVAEWTLAKAQRHTLWRCAVTASREVYVLHTPFFGQGQISYGGI